MDEYICDKCDTKFDAKWKLKRHKEGPIDCKNGEKNDKKMLICGAKECNKKYTRKDSLNRHHKTCKHWLSLKKSKNNNISIKKNNHNDNSKHIKNINNITINCNNLKPFGEEEIDGLTTKDIKEIFNSNENPIIMLIIKTNLNPSKPEYHNVGITDTKSALNYIYDGETWVKEQNKIIMDKLLHAKEKDLNTIHNIVSDTLSQEDNENIQKKIEKIGNVIRKITGIDIKNNKLLIANIIKYIYNHKELFLQSKRKNPGKKISKPKIKTENKGFDLLTDEHLKERFENLYEQRRKIVLKKEIAKDLLSQLLVENKIDITRQKLITDRINETTDKDIINTINSCLIKSLYFGKKINNKIIDDNIEKDRTTNNFINKIMSDKE
ncbi:MAG: mg15 protein [Satyrvirus sp.]|uniref:Mg15 protein n=1 Tax=Satyrvirus sp. TaxID=2487771 RepID=A0A3G5AES9_9VIRU|nr:MAG: mg15 protein [Satyrvirus sp.]